MRGFAILSAGSHGTLQEPFDVGTPAPLLEEAEVQRGEGIWPRPPARTGRGSERQSQVLPPGVLYMGSSFCLELPSGVSPGPGGRSRAVTPAPTAGLADPCPLWSPPLQPCVVLGPSPTAAQAIFSQSPPQRGPRDPGRGRPATPVP